LQKRKKTKAQTMARLIANLHSVRTRPAKLIGRASGAIGQHRANGLRAQPDWAVFYMRLV
jgi:hypothetical protein